MLKYKGSLHKERKLIQFVISIIDMISFSKTIIFALWIIALASLTMAIWKEFTK